MKNRLLTALFLLLNFSILQAQAGGMSVTLSGTETCGCNGCFFIETLNAIGPFTYQWSNGAISTSNANLVNYCGDFCPGQYTVTVTTPNGQSATATGTIGYLFTAINIISLDPSPCPSDSTTGTQSCDKVCAGATVTYTVDLNSPTTPSNTFLQWQVTGASNWVVEQPDNKKITVTWGNPGSGTVSVISNGIQQGCTAEDLLCVTVLDRPKAVIGSAPAAVANTLQVCKGQLVDFQNLSTGDADYFQWFFSDDLSQSSLDAPHHTFFNPGIHTVTLIASSSCLCSDTTTLTVEVLDALAPTLDCVATICPGETVNYSASNACAPFVWTVSSNGTVLEGGTAASDSITIHWNDGPSGTVTLNAPACTGATCPIGGTVHIPIVSDNAEIRGDEQVCPGASEVYTIESFGGCGFVWTLSGGGTITKGQGTNSVSIDWSGTVSASTTYWLSVKYNNCYLGCGGQDSIPVKILSPFYLNGPVEACLDANGAFATKLSTNNIPLVCNWTATDPAGNTVWTSPAPNSNVSIPFINGDGYYRLFAIPAIPNQTCSDQADWAVNVRPRPAKPTSITGSLKVCPGITYTYEAGGTGSGSFFWTVKNGSAAPANFYGKTLNITWNAGGPWWLSVVQLSTDGLACPSDSLMAQISPLGIPAITGVPVLCSDSKAFYSIDAIPFVDLQWQIISPTSGTVISGQGSNVAEIYWSQTGNHVVTLNVCGQNATFPVAVNPPLSPVVQVPTNLCPGETGLVQTTTPYISYAWKDSLGHIISTDPTTILGVGRFAVEVTDANGCQGSTTFVVVGKDAPNISLSTNSPTGFCNNSLFVPLNALTNTDGDYTFQWFQDGALIPGETGVTYTTNQYGNYTVQATNASGCTSVAGPIQLFPYCGGGPAPVPGAICPGGTVSMAIDPMVRCDSVQLHLLDPNGVYVPGTAQWIMGISGGAVLGSSTDTDPHFIMGNAGEYVAIVSVKLTDGSNCLLFNFFTAEAVARFNSLPECPAESTNFIDRSEFIPSGGISNWNWQFGDPASGPLNQSTIRNATHTYDPSGNYNVTLTVTGTSGCTSSATRVAAIPPLPNPVFAPPTQKCVGDALAFSLSTATSDITQTIWNFGDPASGPLNNASGVLSYHRFTTAGIYTVTVTITNVYGCTSSSTQSITVLANSLSGNITPPVPPAICEGKSITLGAPGGGVSWLWSDDNATTTNFLTVSEEGRYRVTVTDANGCTYAPPAVNVEVNAAPDALIKGLLFNDLNQIVGTSYPSQTICVGEDVVLQAVSNTTSNYNWSVSNGNNQLLYFTDDRNNLLTTGTYTYAVTVTNTATGCTAVTDPFEVKVNPVPTGFSISGTSTCANNNNVLTYTGPQPPNWQLLWNTGQSGPSLTTQQPGVYQIRVVNEFGCEARSNPWTVLPGPPASALPSGCHTRCNPDTLCMPMLPTVTSWQWYLNGSPIAGATSPNFIAQQSGTYWAQLTDFYGCTAQSDPLTLNLYTGYGNILGQVWSDVNNNGIIDAADTLLSGIPVVLYQNGSLFDAASSGANGGFAFPNILSTNYSVEIDPASLPPVWNVVIGQDPVSLSGCAVEGTADLLLHYQCVPSVASLQLSACQGDSAVYNGVKIPAGTTQDITLVNWLGCDSIVTVTVSQLPTSFKIVVLSACLGDSASYAGAQIPVGSFQFFHFNNWVGCDSTVEVYVVPWLPSTGTTTLYACPGSTANYAGTDIPVGTTQNFTLQNWHGCDSTLTVNVQPWPTSTGATTLYACPGGTATYAGTDIPVGTTQNFTLPNWHGCDSTLTVTVQPWPTSTGATTLYACPGGTANYAGTDIPVGTTQNFTLPNWHGCDSTLTVNVQPWPTSTGATTLYACPGSTATYAGTDIPVGTTQNFTLPNWHGCDSVVTVSVQAWPTSTGSATLLFACTGGSATYHGTSIPAGTSQQFTLQTWLGCDSIVTVSVAALPPATGSTTLYACPGGSATYNGTSIPVGTSQNFTLDNWLGCDSIVTVNVAQWNSSAGSATLYACPGGSANYAGTSIPVGATQNFTLPNWLGCDSIVSISVAAWPTSTGATTLYACPGGAATYAGVSIPAGTSQNVTLPNWLGCDSVVTVQVTPWATTNSGFAVDVCPGETYVYQGVPLSGGAVQPFVLQNWLGCDSTVTVTVNQLQNSANLVEVSICPGETYTYQGETIPTGDSRDFHLPNAEGCDSTITIFVNEYPGVNFLVHAQRACANAPTGSLEAIVGPGGQGPFRYSLNNLDYQDSTHFSSLAAGQYTMYLEDGNGCVYENNAAIPAIPELAVQLPNGILPCDSAAVTLTPTITGGDAATLHMQWWNGTENNTAVATTAGPVWLEVTDVCETKRSEAKVEWAELAQDLDIVYIPNVLKPSANNPENAQFHPLFASGITVLDFKFMVFDRWGNELFATKNTSSAWDGVFATQDMNPGVQVWYMEADVAICGRVIHVVKKGDVTVVR